MKCHYYASHSKLMELLKHRTWIALDLREALDQYGWFKLVLDVESGRTNCYTVNEEYIGTLE